MGIRRISNWILAANCEGRKTRISPGRWRKHYPKNRPPGPTTSSSRPPILIFISREPPGLVRIYMEPGRTSFRDLDTVYILHEVMHFLHRAPE